MKTIKTTINSLNYCQLLGKDYKDITLKEIEENAESFIFSDWCGISEVINLSVFAFIHKFKGDLDWFVISNRRDLTEKFRLEFGKELSEGENEFWNLNETF